LSDGQIVFIDTADGHVIRKLSVKFVPSALLLGDDHLLVGDDRGNVTNLDVDKNVPIWTFRSGGKISGIYPVGGSDLLVTSFDNFAYLVDRQSGHVTWKRRQPARIVAAAIVNSKYAGVTPFGEPTVFFLDPENGKSLGQLIMPGSIEFIQPAQLVGEAVVAFTNKGLFATGFFGCKRNEKAEAETSAFK
jgi:outer membrane protein assembly factor BamB